MRVDLENRCQSLVEELEFRKSLYDGVSKEKYHPGKKNAFVFYDFLLPALLDNGDCCTSSTYFLEHYFL